MVHRSVAADFTKRICELINGLKSGVPFGKTQITPLPQSDKPEYLSGLVDDAKSLGAQVINQSGGHVDRSLFFPAVLFPVNASMRVWHEEQFGPVIPIAEYESIEEVFSYLRQTPSGQQIAIFTRPNSGAMPSQELAKLIDVCAMSTCRVNLNCQCQRGPDNYPFAGRRSSALGTISVSEVLKAVSVETLVASKNPSDVTAVRPGSKIFAPVLAK